MDNQVSFVGEFQHRFFLSSPAKFYGKEGGLGKFGEL